MEPSSDDDHYDLLLCHELLDHHHHHHHHPLCLSSFPRPPPHSNHNSSSYSCCISAMDLGDNTCFSSSRGDAAAANDLHVDDDSDAGLSLLLLASARETISVFLERLRWPHCRPLPLYSEAMAADEEIWLRRRFCGKMTCRRRDGSTCADGSMAYARRTTVQWILEASKATNATMSATCQAVSYLDRFLASNSKQVIGSNIEEVHLAGATCLWIAMKMDDSDTAPDAAFFQRMNASLRSMEDMEARILHALQWRLLQVTAADFTDSLLHLLPHSILHIPFQLVCTLQQRAHEILQGVLQEVTFVRHEVSVVAVCAIQYTLEEIVPLQAASILRFVHEIIAPIDMEATKECYKTMGDLVVDPLNINIGYINSSPDRVFQALTPIL